MWTVLIFPCRSESIAQPIAWFWCKGYFLSNSPCDPEIAANFTLVLWWISNRNGILNRGHGFILAHLPAISFLAYSKVASSEKECHFRAEANFQILIKDDQDKKKISVD